MQHHHRAADLGAAPRVLQGDWSQRLASDENVRATLEVDLSETLQFASGLLVLSERRLLARNYDGAWREWTLAPGLGLRLVDHGGVGTLELHDDARRIALWRFTLAQNPAAQRLLREFERRIGQIVRGGWQARDSDQGEPLCPVCQSEMPPDAEECPVCARAQPPQPSTWVLLRLWRFARPYRKQLAAGFALTLASTAATLVPPYL
ncbi:MAG: ABC transporter, partial [Burkholderiaceae bacterium]|nr:ABC transporter [Burkholderiaceae bacterium]